MGSRLAKALAMLAIVGGTVFAAGEPAVANSGATNTAPGNPPTAAKEVASFPVLGIPFVSGSFIGTVEVESFRAQGGKIVADTVLRRVGQKATRATLPVQITQASCHLLQLRVGPPKGAIHPLVITQHQGNSDLNVSEFCGIANANGVKAQVVALNEGGDLGVGLKSCSWIKAVGCAFAAASCGGTCIAGPAACIACFIAIGAPACYDCFS